MRQLKTQQYRRGVAGWPGRFGVSPGSPGVGPPPPRWRNHPVKADGSTNRIRLAIEELGHGVGEQLAEAPTEFGKARELHPVQWLADRLHIRIR